MTIRPIRYSSVIGGFVLAASVALGAQGQLPVNGGNAVNGTVVADDSSDSVWRGLSAVVAGIADGVGHIAHFTKRLFVHAGKGAGDEAAAQGRLPASDPSLSASHGVEGGAKR
jgi:hypothetical protein